MADLIRNIICERRIYTDTCYTHAHDYAQLLLPLQGTLYIETDLHDVTLNNQHLFFLPPGDNHTFYSKDKNEFLVLDIPLSFLAGDTALKQMSGGVYQTLDERWQALRYLLLSESHDKPVHSQGINDLVRYAGRLLGQNAQPASIKYIQEHYHEEKISLQQLATLEHYNLSYYCEWFQKKTGLSPMAYIQQLRLSKAKELLLHTDLPLLQIAQEVGYQQQSSLTRLFKEQEKLSPSVYRQNNRK